MSASPPTAASITARLDRLPASREIWKLVILLSLGGGFELYDLLMTGYVAPGLVRSGIFSPGHTGLFGLPDQAAFASVTFAGLFVGTIGFGYVADTFGRRKIFTWALLWYSVMTVIMACQNSVLGVDIWRFIAGLGIGVELVTIDTYIAELVPKQMRGRAFTVNQAIQFCSVPPVALLSWLLENAPRTYQMILDGERRSRKSFRGHSSAMAQVYNHIILPLASRRDRVTQIRWGVADYQRHYGTLPEGMRPSVLSVRGLGGTVRPAPPQPRWLCYGDSIAEGWAASNPGRAWPAVAGRRYGLDVVNLGYAGAARGEMVSAEEIAGLSADVISLSYGTNCWTRIQHSAEQVGAGLDAFVDLVRTGHPDTPIVVASPVIRPDAEAQQNGLGATLADLRAVIEARIERRCALDPRLHLVRGGALLTADQLADGVHPGDEGHRVLAEAIGSAVRASLDAAANAAANTATSDSATTATSDSAITGPRA